MIAERHHGTDLSSTLARAFSAMSSNNGKRGYHCPLDHGYAKSYPDADTGLIRRFSGLEDMKLSSDQVAASA
jgi:hypothetical protein